jgi:hypothetical protein
MAEEDRRNQSKLTAAELAASVATKPAQDVGLGSCRKAASRKPQTLRRNLLEARFP